MAIIEAGRVILSVLALFLPGALFIRRSEWRRADPVEIAATALAGAACFWAVGFWYLPLARLPLSLFGASSVAVAGLVLATRGYRERAAVAAAVIANRRWIACGAVFVAAIIGLRALFALTRIAGSVGDMTAHADITELILLNDGFPKTYEPLMAIDRFGEVSPGFHVFSALVSQFAGIPAYRSTIVILCLAVVGLTFALYAFLRELGIPRAACALGAGGSLFLARNPQFFVQWGGAPTLLAAVVALVLLRECLRMHQRNDALFTARAGLFAAGLVLIHVLPAVSTLYLAPAVAVAALWAGERRALVGLRWIFVQGGGAALVAILLAHRLLLVVPHTISPRIESWSRGWLRTELDRALGFQESILSRVGLGAIAAEPGLHSWPFYLAVFLGILPAALLVIGLLSAWIRGVRQAALAATVVLTVQLVLFSGALAERLPLWPSLYPSRIGLWLIVPLGVAISQLLVVLAERVPRRTLAPIGGVWLLLFAAEGARLAPEHFGTAYYEQARGGADLGALASMAANEAAGGAFWIATYNRDNAVLTRDDLAAFDWIRRESSPSAVFATNYGDGGNLIPSTTHRKVLAPHYYFFFYEDEMRAWQESCAVSHLYVGSEESPAWPRRYTAAALASDERVELVFRAGEARVYRVVDRSVIDRTVNDHSAIDRSAIDRVMKNRIADNRAGIERGQR